MKYEKEKFKNLFKYSKKLDNIVFVFQNILILTFSYKEKIWSIFVVVMFICFFAFPIIYLSKLVKDFQFNMMLKDLTTRNLIPSWILKRRYLNNIVWFFFMFGFIFYTLIISHISYFFPVFLVIIVSTPWLIFKLIINKKEYEYIEKFF